MEQLLMNIAALLPMGYGFGAGMVATVNPCGFAMLPAYISLYLGTQDADFQRTTVVVRGLKAIALGLAVTLGFVTLLGVAGIFVSLGGQFLIALVPWASVAIGIALVALGLLLLTGQGLPAGFAVRLALRVGNPGAVGIRGFFLFGVAYAMVSLSCTLPIFLAVVGNSIALGNAASGIAQFVSYGLGMGAVFLAIAISAALFKGIVAGLLRRLVPYVERVSALLLVTTGAYIIYSWFAGGGLP